jgi:hypothetical protein
VKYAAVGVCFAIGQFISYLIVSTRREA